MATAVAKKKKVRINGCVASAQAARYADVDVITAYPIRPYTATMMALAQMVANGELDAEYIVADSEHSQFSIAHGPPRVARACSPAAPVSACSSPTSSTRPSRAAACRCR